MDVSVILNQMVQLFLVMAAGYGAERLYERDRKAEPLSGNLQGQYSRRVNEKDRLFYHMETDGSTSPTAEATMAINNPTQSLNPKPQSPLPFLS